MLQKKIDRGADFLSENLGLFQCPNCYQPLVEITDYTVKCAANHQYDLSKKGTVYFLNHTIKTDYDTEMLQQRQLMIDTGLYEPLIQELMAVMARDQVASLVDMGCGEGSFLKALADNGIPGTKIGFDISKDGVNLATEQDLSAFWCVADITNLPFNSGAISHLLNIFSPSHYQEFRRVLQPDGKLIKVVPEAGYLKELRELFYEDEFDKQEYSNEKVVKKFTEEMTLVSQKRLTYQFAVPADKQAALLKMSPLHWGASTSSFNKAATTNIDKITIDVLVLVGRK